MPADEEGVSKHEEEGAMESSNVSALLFAKNLDKVAVFYAKALGMTRTVSDEYHWALKGHGAPPTTSQTAP